MSDGPAYVFATGLTIWFLSLAYENIFPNEEILACREERSELSQKADLFGREMRRLDEALAAKERSEVRSVANSELQLQVVRWMTKEIEGMNTSELEVHLEEIRSLMGEMYWREFEDALNVVQE